MNDEKLVQQASVLRSLRILDEKLSKPGTPQSKDDLFLMGEFLRAACDLGMRESTEFPRVAKLLIRYKPAPPIE